MVRLYCKVCDLSKDGEQRIDMLLCRLAEALFYAVLINFAS